MTVPSTAAEATTVLRSLIYMPPSDGDGDDYDDVTATTNMVAETKTTPARLRVLDQLLLPERVVYVPVPDLMAAWHVIHRMQIRGAPLIAIVAVLGLAVDLAHGAATRRELRAVEDEANGRSRRAGGVGGAEEDDHEASADAVRAYIQAKMDYIATSRPTAVNLFNALEEVRHVVAAAAATRPYAPAATAATASSSDGNTSSKAPTPRQRMVAAVVRHAEFMLRRDEADCRAIGRHGAAEILDGHGAHLPSDSRRNDKNYPDNAADDGVTIMTICNTGSLATAAYGTALGVVRAVHEARRLRRVVVLETRPYNQGSRLTCVECRHDALPGAILVCDSMAAAYMALHRVTACVVGADRVVANGDTANKIGTYQLALVARAHHVPFYVAAPCTTLDVHTATGDAIRIEERPASELLATSHAPADMPVWNPAFDVTPAKYISGIITEKGIIKPDAHGVIDVKAFVAQHSGNDAPVLPKTKPPSSLQVPADYTEQTVSSLPLYLATHVPKAMEVLGATTADELSCVEMGDGNLNLVFIVANRTRAADAAKVIVKQALPYVRCVGESWPLTLERSYFEYAALAAEKEACPAFVPHLYHFSQPHALIVMQYLAPPVQILRKGLVQRVRYPTVASDLGIFCAATLFRTSGFAYTAPQLRDKVAFWSRNADMCALTEQVVFTEPYVVAANNRWTSPQLDADKRAIERDGALKLAAAAWKVKFVTHTECLIHADLHTGSVMAAPVGDHQTFVIDPEFAFYGPAAFDTGALVANLFLSYVSQAGHRPPGGTGAATDDYAEWILAQIAAFWQTFATEFVQLWNDPAEHTGFVYGRDVFPGNDNDGDDEVSLRVRCQEAYLKSLLADTLGFAGMKMLRRVVGIAHVEDLESIVDVDVRARCERRALSIATAFIKSPASFGTMEDAIQCARSATPGTMAC